MTYLRSALCFFLVSLSSLQAGQLVFETETVEMKAGLLDELSTAVFRFTNESDETIVIEKLKSSCGCTVPQLTKRDYAPGESGEISAIFKFGGRHGVQRKRITVTTSDETYNLMFMTEIPTWATITPQLIRWSIGNPPTPKEVRLQVESSEDIELVEPNIRMEHFTVKDLKVEGDEWVYSIVPNNTEERATERVIFTLRTKDGSEEGTRQMAFHCLIR